MPSGSPAFDEGRFGGNRFLELLRVDPAVSCRLWCQHVATRGRGVAVDVHPHLFYLQFEDAQVQRAQFRRRRRISWESTVYVSACFRPSVVMKQMEASIWPLWRKFWRLR